MERLNDVMGRMKRPGRGARGGLRSLVTVEKDQHRLSLGSFLDEEGVEDGADQEEGVEENVSNVIERTVLTGLPVLHNRHTNTSSTLPMFALPLAPAALPELPSVCPICKGAGYLRLDVPFGHPNFGKPVPCACKQAKKSEHRRQLLRQLSNIEALEEFRDATFERFDVFRPGVVEACEAAEQFARAPRGWLALVGGNGCGKTHLAIAIAKQRIEEGDLVLFLVVADLLAHLRASFAPQAKVSFDDLFGKMCKADVLILDDLGAEQSTPWANEKLFQLLNYRYNGHLPTVITTNLIGFVGIEPRLRSRLGDRQLVKLIEMKDAGDFRLHREEGGSREL